MDLCRRWRQYALRSYHFTYSGHVEVGHPCGSMRYGGRSQRWSMEHCCACDPSLIGKPNSRAVNINVLCFCRLCWWLNISPDSVWSSALSLSITLVMSFQHQTFSSGWNRVRFTPKSGHPPLIMGTYVSGPLRTLDSQCLIFVS